MIFLGGFDSEEWKSPLRHSGIIQAEPGFSHGCCWGIDRVVKRDIKCWSSCWNASETRRSRSMRSSVGGSGLGTRGGKSAGKSSVKSQMTDQRGSDSTETMSRSLSTWWNQRCHAAGFVKRKKISALAFTQKQLKLNKYCFNNEELICHFTLCFKSILHPALKQEIF